MRKCLQQRLLGHGRQCFGTDLWSRARHDVRSHARSNIGWQIIAAVEVSIDQRQLFDRDGLGRDSNWLSSSCPSGNCSLPCRLEIPDGRFAHDNRARHEVAQPLVPLIHQRNYYADSVKGRQLVNDSQQVAPDRFSRRERAPSFGLGTTWGQTNPPSIGANLLSATNPENGTVTYTYNSNNLLSSKTDANGQHFTYAYDSYNRLNSITWTNSPSGSVVLRSFMYDSNTLDGSFTSYGLGRLVAVQNAQQPMNSPQGGVVNIVEMYSYRQAGEANAKRLQLQEQAGSLNMDAHYTYDNEGDLSELSELLPKYSR